LDNTLFTRITIL